MKKQFRPPFFIPWLLRKRLWYQKKAVNAVFLTFDDGPTASFTDWILNELAKHDIKATFFCVGTNAEKFPELMQRIQEEGHAVGNHTMCHERGTKVSRKSYLKSIEDTSRIVPSKLFRPPYGRIPMTYTPSISKDYRIIMWSWLSYDFDPSVSIETILKKAETIRAGDIIVLHDNEKVTDRVKIILPGLIRVIQQKNLKFATLSA